MVSEQLLMDMGFPKEQVDKAIKACGESTEQAMEWLLAHAEDNSTQNSGTIETTSSTEEPMDAASSNEKSDSPIEEKKIEVPVAKSLKCDECGKLFKSNDEVEFHAMKSGHSSFSESTEEKKPLTDEEKKEKLKLLEEKMKQRRKEKEMEDRNEVIQREKKRIEMGKNISETKHKMQEKEMKLLAEEKRREKIADKLARQRVKDEIERDKLARKEMFGGAAPPQAAPPAASTSSVPPAPKKEYKSTRLQIRLPNGSPLVTEFKAKEPLSAVRLWIHVNRTDDSSTQRPFTLSTTFPRKVFSEEDMDKPLDILGLIPSAVLVMTEQKRPISDVDYQYQSI